jgi:hypothetical protein
MTTPRLSPTPARTSLPRTDFARLTANGALSEQRAETFVVISCGVCAVQWERNFPAGRPDTAAARRAARDHVLTQHPIAYNAAPPSEDATNG